jgi:hypothetical protein
MEEKATLKGMVESRDEHITKITKEIRLDCMRDDAEDEDEDEDGNDGGDATTIPIVVLPPPASAPLVAAAPEEVVEEEDPVEIVPEQEVPVAYEVILVGADHQLPHPISTIHS